MTVDGSIIDNFPPVVPKSEIVAEDQFSVSADDTHTYSLSKSPYTQLFSVTGVVDGIQRELEIGSEVVRRDETETDGYDSVRIEDVDLDVGTTLRVEYYTESNIQKYTEPLNDDIESVGSAVDTVIQNKSVETADSTGLERIGDQFGDLGSRSGRSDEEYRAYLRSLVPTFTARGTKDDIKIAVASVTGVDKDQITISEDTEQVGFQVLIDADTVIEGASELSRVIDLASPSGVALLSDPVVRTKLVVAALTEPQVSDSYNGGLGSDELGGADLGTLAGPHEL